MRHSWHSILLQKITRCPLHVAMLISRIDTLERSPCNSKKTPSADLACIPLYGKHQHLVYCCEPISSTPNHRLRALVSTHKKFGQTKQRVREGKLKMALDLAAAKMKSISQALVPCHSELRHAPFYIRKLTRNPSQQERSPLTNNPRKQRPKYM